MIAQTVKQGTQTEDFFSIKVSACQMLQPIMTTTCSFGWIIRRSQNYVAFLQKAVKTERKRKGIRITDKDWNVLQVNLFEE